MPTDAHRKERRSRRRYGCLVTTILMVVALILGTYGIVSRVLPGVTPEMCRVDASGESVTYTPEQAQNAATIAAVGVRRKLPSRAVTIALATAMQESKLRNLNHGDRDSLGLFQQRPSQGWGTPEQLQDPVYATGEFYDHLVRIRGYQDRPLTEVAQDVQRSGYPEAYARHEDQADLLMRVFTGRVPAAVTCRLADPGPTGSAADLAADMKTQLGISPAVRGDSVTGVLSSRQLAWAAAHWSVAHASRTGATSVTVGDRTWVRGRGTFATRWETGRGSGGPTELSISMTPQ